MGTSLRRCLLLHRFRGCCKNYFELFLGNSQARFGPRVGWGKIDLMENALSNIDASGCAVEGYTVFDDAHPTVIVMHAAVGSGHRSAAKAVAEAFQVLRSTHGSVPSDLRVEFLDVLELGRVRFDGDKTASSFTGPMRPVYDITWRFTLTGRLLWGGGTAWSRIMFPSFTQHVKAVKPLAVVATHITAANVAVGARMLTGQNFPVVCVPTDYETEGMWPHKSADLFCVATEHMAETLRPRKVPEECIRITGIPTRMGFSGEYNKAAERDRFGLPQDKKVVLVLAGARLSQPYVRFRTALDQMIPYLHLFSEMQMVFVAGSDADYAAHLRREKEERGLSNMTVLDYVDNMAALMAVSDIAVCKSGGLTVTECLCSKLPMILLGKAYGQENINVRMLTSVGAASHVTTYREFMVELRRILRNPQVIDAMLMNGGFIRRPDAAIEIAQAALELAQRDVPKTDPRRKKHFLHFYWGGKPAHTR